MALTTVFRNPSPDWSVEEDGAGRLWLEVVCGLETLYSIHHELTLGERNEFLEAERNLEPLVRRILCRPRSYADKKIEAEYRRQSGVRR